jgi:hypothetical protein
VQIAVEMDGGFLCLMTVGGQAGEELNEEVERAAMAAALDLADVLELVVPALDERARLRSSSLSV